MLTRNCLRSFQAHKVFSCASKSNLIRLIGPAIDPTRGLSFVSNSCRQTLQTRTLNWQSPTSSLDSLNRSNTLANCTASGSDIGSTGHIPWPKTSAIISQMAIFSRRWHSLWPRSTPQQNESQDIPLMHRQQDGLKQNEEASSSSAPDPVEPADPQNQKKKPGIFKKYGTAAIVIYLLLSLIDFLCCFIAVRALPPEKIFTLEKTVKGAFQKIYAAIGIEYKGHDPQPAAPGGEQLRTPEEVEAAAAAAAGTHPSVWTQLVIAYGIHKLLNFVRFPLTAAITPPIVKALAKRGYRIGGGRQQRS